MTDGNGASARAWPTRRGGYDAIASTFGADRADLAQWALTTGDPLMDAVVDEIHAGPSQVQAMLQQGIRGGLASLEKPTPAVRALLEQVEAVPPYVDEAFLANEASPFFTTPAPIHMTSLSAGALIRVYASPSIAAVLSNTGRLVDGAERRLQETGKWLVTTMIPGALRRGAPGYIATLQVRLLHAHMRKAVLRQGYDPAAHGAPINQVDLARTWMDFTLTSFVAEAAMGFDLTEQEIAQAYRTWWYVGHLLGVDARLIEGIASNEQAARMDALLQAVTGPLVPEASALANATVGSVAAQLRNQLRLPVPVGTRLLRALARRFHGDALADELGLARHPVAGALVAAVAGRVRGRRQALRQAPDRWAANRRSNIDSAKALLAGQNAALFEDHRHG
ncbi:MAG: DUF2236 domain-containing protein [Sphingopyxis macrogoltabida]|uniref:DUF2236 domain-containing protein n=1 Tax=Sphingopyxis macrogoltabida TaxID=33050 RepID=A0A2W5N3V6_SPHMC|nr:MAG: DUF2236 domain-containing protein [Sphingopyxis macrogoltabida]